MGLCKCPKRQVTNQFCFEHRVNVCEHCMVTNHPKCIVQSYLQWLKDSDYNPNCTLCGSTLESNDCVRLICYHVFHWNCLNNREESLPANTAPGGHTCPTCNDQIFPPTNLVSSVADVLRSRLGQVNWGRNELGLPLLSDDKQRDTNTVFNSNQQQQKFVIKKTNNNLNASNNNNSNNINNDKNILASPHSILNIDAFSTTSNYQSSSRRPLLARESPIGGSDRDDNKYKRRTPSEIFSRWSRRLYAPSSRPPWRRTWFLVIVGIILFLTLVYFMAKFGRSTTFNNEINDINNAMNPNMNHDE